MNAQHPLGEAVGGTYGLGWSDGAGMVPVGARGFYFQTARVALVAAMASTAATKAQRMPEKAPVQLKRKTSELRTKAVAD